MYLIAKKLKSSGLMSVISIKIIISLLLSTVILPSHALAQSAVIPSAMTGMMLTPGSLPPSSIPVFPPVLRSVSVDFDNPFHLNFIVDHGQQHLENEMLRDISDKLIKYFLASLTISEEDLWVNLSPEERDRIMPQALGETEMGRVLLAQDYQLKRLAVSLTNPQNKVGENFWRELRKNAIESLGNDDISNNIINKIWITPDSADVIEQGNSGVVVGGTLKVMFEDDYLNIKNHVSSESGNSDSDHHQIVSRELYVDMFKKAIIPEIEKEVNEGELFAPLRQIYYSMILATWYKQKIRKLIHTQNKGLEFYIDQKKIAGINDVEEDAKQKIYDQYMDSVKKGIYNFIQEEYDPQTQSILPRKYFSGGIIAQGVQQSVNVRIIPDTGNLIRVIPSDNPLSDVEINLDFAQLNADSLIRMDRDKISEFLNLEQNRNHKFRGLIWTDDADAVEAHLSKIAAQEGLPFLRLTLREENDLEKLMTTVMEKNGRIEKRPGKLIEIFESGGILQIDNFWSSPKVLLALNSLFDSHPYFRDRKNLSDDLHIVTTMRDEQLRNYSADYYTRHRSNKMSFVPQANPLGNLYEISVEDNEDALELDLYHMFDSREVRQTLLGKYVYTHNGLEAQPGALIQAIQTNSSLIIKGGIWDDLVDDRYGKIPSELRRIIREMRLSGKVEFNGVSYQVPEGFRIISRWGRYEKGVEHKRLLAVGELSDNHQDNNEPVWIINPYNQDILFRRHAIVDDPTGDHKSGILVHNPGILFNQSVRLRIVDDLHESVWHRIFHENPDLIADIEVMPGVLIPPAYRDLRSARLIQSLPDKVYERLDDALRAKNILIEGDDLELIKEQIFRIFGDRESIDVIPISRDLTMEDLIEKREVDKIQDGAFTFKRSERDLLKNLRAGRIVVLDGLQTNLQLFKDFESALSENPYLMENGERIFLNDLPGKLILLTEAYVNSPFGQTQVAMSAAHHVKFKDEDENKILNDILSSEFHGEYSEQNFSQVMQTLDDLENNIPLPRQRGDYPEKINRNLSRLRLLYKAYALSGSWLKAFEAVITSSYVTDPEVTAQVRNIIRLHFDEDFHEYESQQNYINGEKLMYLLNQMPTHTSKRVKQKIVWSDPFEGFEHRLAETLSLDLLKKVEKEKNPNEEIRRIIQEALIFYYQKKSADDFKSRAAYYRKLFSIDSTILQAAEIDFTSSESEDHWQEQEDQILFSFKLTRGVLLVGGPSRGKSYMTKIIAERLGYVAEGENRNIAGPFTVGSDTRESTIIIDHKFNPDTGEKTTFYHQIADWAGANPDKSQFKDGGLLIVDESNLTVSNFWDFFKSVFSSKPYVRIDGVKYDLTDNHRILFTGNGETTKGRHLQSLIQEYMVRIPFDQFSKKFIHNEVDSYVSQNVKRRNELVDQITDIHFFIQQHFPSLEFSLREVQEISARVNILLDLQSGREWSSNEVIELAWTIYKGSFNETERGVLDLLLSEKYGVDTKAYLQKRISRIKDKWQKSFTKKNIALPDSVAEVVADIDDFLTMYQARLDNQDPLLNRIQGKRGIVLEGPSSWGKDIVARLLLDVMSERDPRIKVNHITASVNPQEILKVIEEAKRSGGIPLISEMNALPASFLDGQLNDGLTGESDEQMGIISTVNSEFFSGRERLSSALLNRIIHILLDEHTQDALISISQMMFSEFDQLLNLTSSDSDDSDDVNKKELLSEDDFILMVKAHLWIRDQIENPALKPTVRDIREVIWRSMWDLDLSDDAEEARQLKKKRILEHVRNVYGALYLNKLLNNQNIPSVEELIDYKPLSNVKQLKKAAGLAQALLPSSTGKVEIGIDDKVNSGRIVYDQNQHAVLFHQALDVVENLDGQLIEEMKRARVYRPYLLNSTSRHILISDLDKIRQDRTYTKQFPYTNRISPIDSQVAEMGRMLDDGDQGVLKLEGILMNVRNTGGFTRLPAKLFREVLLWYAITDKPELTKRRIEQFADAFEGKGPGKFSSKINPFRLALEHLETVRELVQLIPVENDEQDAQYQQFIFSQKSEPIRKTLIILNGLQNDHIKSWDPISKKKIAQRQRMPQKSKKENKLSPAIEAIVIQSQREFWKAVEDFFRFEDLPDRRTYGPNGSLDEHELSQSADVSKSYVSPGGIVTKQRKEVVLTGRLNALVWEKNPMLEGLFDFLMTQNHFQFTVYTSLPGSDEMEYQIVKSVDELKQILSNVHPDLSSEDIEISVSDRHRTQNDYLIVSVSELQQRIEGIFAVNALRNKAVKLQEELKEKDQARKVKEEEEKYAEAQAKQIQQAQALPSIPQQTLQGDGFLEDVEKLNEFIKDYKDSFGEAEVSFAIFDGEIDLDVSKLNLEQSLKFFVTFFTFRDQLKHITSITLIANQLQRDLYLKRLESHAIENEDSSFKEISFDEKAGIARFRLKFPDAQEHLSEIDTAAGKTFDVEVFPEVADGDPTVNMAEDVAKIIEFMSSFTTSEGRVVRFRVSNAGNRTIELDISGVNDSEFSLFDSEFNHSTFPTLIRGLDNAQKLILIVNDQQLSQINAWFDHIFPPNQRVRLHSAGYDSEHRQNRVVFNLLPIDEESKSESDSFEEPIIFQFVDYMKEFESLQKFVNEMNKKYPDLDLIITDVGRRAILINYGQRFSTPTEVFDLLFQKLNTLKFTAEVRVAINETHFFLFHNRMSVLLSPNQRSIISYQNPQHGLDGRIVMKFPDAQDQLPEIDSEDSNDQMIDENADGEFDFKMTKDVSRIIEFMDLFETATETKQSIRVADVGNRTIELDISQVNDPEFALFNSEFYHNTLQALIGRLERAQKLILIVNDQQLLKINTMAGQIFPSNQRVRFQSSGYDPVHNQYRVVLNLLPFDEELISDDYEEEDLEDIKKGLEIDEQAVKAFADRERLNISTVSTFNQKENLAVVSIFIGQAKTITKDEFEALLDIISKFSTAQRVNLKLNKNQVIKFRNVFSEFFYDEYVKKMKSPMEFIDPDEGYVYFQINLSSNLLVDDHEDLDQSTDDSDESARLFYQDLGLFIELTETTQGSAMVINPDSGKNIIVNVSNIKNLTVDFVQEVFRQLPKLVFFNGVTVIYDHNKQADVVSEAIEQDPELKVYLERAFVENISDQNGDKYHLIYTKYDVSKDRNDDSTEEDRSDDPVKSDIPTFDETYLYYVNFFKLYGAIFELQEDGSLFVDLSDVNEFHKEDESFNPVITLRILLRQIDLLPDLPSVRIKVNMEQEDAVRDMIAERQLNWMELINANYVTPRASMKAPEFIEFIFNYISEDDDLESRDQEFSTEDEQVEQVEELPDGTQTREPVFQESFEQVQNFLQVFNLTVSTIGHDTLKIDFNRLLYSTQSELEERIRVIFQFLDKVKGVRQTQIFIKNANDLADEIVRLTEGRYDNISYVHRDGDERRSVTLYYSYPEFNHEWETDQQFPEQNSEHNSNLSRQLSGIVDYLVAKGHQVVTSNVDNIENGEFTLRVYVPSEKSSMPETINDFNSIEGVEVISLEKSGPKIDSKLMQRNLLTDKDPFRVWFIELKFKLNVSEKMDGENHMASSNVSDDSPAIPGDMENDEFRLAVSTEDMVEIIRRDFAEKKLNFVFVRKNGEESEHFGQLVNNNNDGGKLHAYFIYDETAGKLMVDFGMGILNHAFSEVEIYEFILIEHILDLINRMPYLSEVEFNVSQENILAFKNKFETILRFNRRYKRMLFNESKPSISFEYNAKHHLDRQENVSSEVDLAPYRIQANIIEEFMREFEFQFWGQMLREGENHEIILDFFSGSEVWNNKETFERLIGNLPGVKIERISSEKIESGIMPAELTGSRYQWSITFSPVNSNLAGESATQVKKEIEKLTFDEYLEKVFQYFREEISPIYSNQLSSSLGEIILTFRSVFLPGADVMRDALIERGIPVVDLQSARRGVQGMGNDVSLGNTFDVKIVLDKKFIKSEKGMPEGQSAGVMADEFLQSIFDSLIDPLAVIEQAREVMAFEGLSEELELILNSLSLPQSMSDGLSPEDWNVPSSDSDRAELDVQKEGSLKSELTPGGIDLNPATMNLNVHAEQGKGEYFVDPQIIPSVQFPAGFEFNGLVPVIINITPLTAPVSAVSERLELQVSSK